MSAVGRDPDGFGDMATMPDRVQPDAHQLGLHRHLLVSERLRVRRRQLGLTQREVVARLRVLGVDSTNKALSSLEHGAGLDVCKLIDLARALECTLTYLVGLSSDPLRWEPDRAGWPRGSSTVTERLPAEPAAPVAGTQAPNSDGHMQRSHGPWILGPVPDLRRQR